MSPVLALGLPNGSEMLLIFLVVLLLFGSKKLPELARGLGKSMHEFRKAKDEFEGELHAAKTELTVNEPAQRQLANNPAAAANAAALEQQVRELQDQLRQMNQRDPVAVAAHVDPLDAAKPVLAAVPTETVVHPVATAATTPTPGGPHQG